MATLVFGMNVSLDGYVDHTGFAPSPALFRHFVEEARAQTGSLYGRRMYEIMRYWDEDQPGWSDDERAFASAWRRQHKWVVSRTLGALSARTESSERSEIAPDHNGACSYRKSRSTFSEHALVGPNATLIGDNVEGAVRALKEREAGEIEVAGPCLAGSLGALGLIDVYRMYLHPVVLGAGTAYFAGPRPRLRLLAHERITGEDVIRLTYVPA